MANNLASYPSSFEVERGEFKGADIQVVAMQFTPDLLVQLLGEDARHFNLSLTLQSIDPRLCELLAAAGSEVEEGCPSGKLYAEGLSLAILGCLNARLMWGYEGSRRHIGRLDPKTLASVVGFVHDNMGGDISISDLATLARLSSSQFSRAFKNATGMTPYRYIQEQRMKRAVSLMKSSLPLVDIAFAVGMTSQSHFTGTFRKIVGVSPGRLRADGRRDAAFSSDDGET